MPESAATNLEPPPVHPNHYWYRDGMPLRPLPAGHQHLTFYAVAQRRRYLAPWIPGWRETPRPTPIHDLVADHMWQGDELMDAVVEDFRRMKTGAGRRLFERALDHGIGSIEAPSPALSALFEQLDTPPAWFDRALWEEGRRCWIDASFAGKMGMGMQDFIATYVGTDVSSAVGATGRFVNVWAKRQLESNVWFWNMTKPDVIDRFSPTFKDVIRVRLMHAQVRAGLRRSWGPEHYERFGEPISNSAMLGGAITFGLSPLIIDYAHGRRRPPAELEASMWYWNYIAYLMGVTDELLPRSVAEAMQELDFIAAHAGGATEWTSQMANSGVAAISQMCGPAGRLFQHSAAPFLGFVAFYSGEPAVRELIRDTPLRDVRLADWRMVAAVAVNLNIRARATTDHLPGRRAVMRLRARSNDPFWRLAVRMIRPVAADKGVRSTPYDHHDHTPNTPAGCPIEQAPVQSANG
ncbi:MAG: DUF2236 domain-containing protein [Nocardia sp.]|nr:DUF2236 domain-containing protein [Nocardia sp.]